MKSKTVIKHSMKIPWYCLNILLCLSSNQPQEQIQQLEVNQAGVNRTRTNHPTCGELQIAADAKLVQALHSPPVCRVSRTSSQNAAKSKFSHIQSRNILKSAPPALLSVLESHVSKERLILYPTCIPIKDL